MEERTWRELWMVVYHYVGLHLQSPDRFPLHPNFWGEEKWFDGTLMGPRRPFSERLLRLGPTPQRREIECLIGYGPGDTETWLRRRVKYIESGRGAS